MLVYCTIYVLLTIYQPCSHYLSTTGQGDQPPFPPATGRHRCGQKGGAIPASPEVNGGFNGKIMGTCSMNGGLVWENHVKNGCSSAMSDCWRAI